MCMCVCVYIYIYPYPERPPDPSRLRCVARPRTARRLQTAQPRVRVFCISIIGISSSIVVSSSGSITGP